MIVAHGVSCTYIMCNPALEMTPLRSPLHGCMCSCAPLLRTHQDFAGGWQPRRLVQKQRKGDNSGLPGASVRLEDQRCRAAQTAQHLRQHVCDWQAVGELRDLPTQRRSNGRLRDCRAGHDAKCQTFVGIASPRPGCLVCVRLARCGG